MESTSDGTMQVCTFRAAGRLFGVDILHVKEVTSEMVFTPIYHAPPEMRGYVNIRGQIHLVIDMRRLLGFPPRDPDRLSRIVIFKHTVGDPFGILVDSVGDVVSVEEKRIEDRRKDEKGAPEGVERRGAKLGLGVYQLQDQLLVILHAPNILPVLREATLQTAQT